MRPPLYRLSYTGKWEMANRFGRRRKRALEQRIKDLEIQAFGPAGRCPDHVPSIDDRLMGTKYLRITDDPRGRYEASAEVDIFLNNQDTADRVYGLYREGLVQMDGRCWRATKISGAQITGRLADPITVTVAFEQVTPPTTRRW